MKIDDVSNLIPSPKSASKTGEPAGASSFAKMMEASVSMSDLAAKNNPGHTQETKQESDIRKIRNQGFRAYAEEVQARKMAELREKILERMGLTEDDLNNLPAEQRAAIEDMIAQEIQRRMQANAELSESGSAGSTTSAAAARAIADATTTGAAGAVLLNIVEDRSQLPDQEDGNQLPDKGE